MDIGNIVRKYRDPLGRVLGAVRRAERFLGPDDDWVEKIRGVVFRTADGPMRDAGRQTIRKKGTADYVTTVHATPDAVEEALHPYYERNLASTKKYRDHGDGIQWTVGTWVHDPADTDWQHHVYLFEAPDGGCDLYAHRETSVREPVGHLNDPQRHGDPNGRVRRRLHEAGLPFGKRPVGK